jgi:hypothetical protein
VTNGGFEATPDFSGWTQFGDTGFTSVLTSAAHSGTDGAFFAPGSPGGIFQTISTMPGGQYELSFWLANTTSDANSFIASWNGSTLLALSNAAASAFTKFTFDVTAAGPSTDLRFTFQHTGFLGAFYFDDVSVTPLAAAVVPEPSTIALIAVTAMALLAGGAQRFRGPSVTPSRFRRR